MGKSSTNQTLIPWVVKITLEVIPRGGIVMLLVPSLVDAEVSAIAVGGEVLFHEYQGFIARAPSL